MKGLFIVFHGFAAHNGISKKIFYQCDALRRCGAELRLCSLEVGADGSHRRILDGETLENFGHGLRAKLKKRFSYRSVTDYIRREGVRFLYVRFDHNANPALIRWFAHLKKLGVRIVMEIPTFPYDPEYARASRKTKLVLSVDKCFRNALARQVDRIVTFSQYDTIFERPTIRISNGIDFAHIPLKTNVNDTSNTVHLLGVADIHFWHGFDRVVAGLADYYRRPHEKEVIFHIVGGGSRFTVPELREQVREQGMEERVVLHGPLWGEALDRAFEEADLGIAMGGGSDIAMDVAKMTIISSDLTKIPEALKLSRLTVRTIRQNLFWAFIYNIIGVPVAAGVLYPVNGFLLNPMIAGAAMAFSSVSVVTNSLRLKRKKIETAESPAATPAGQPENKVEPSTENVMKKEFKVEGMMCNHCRMHVEKALNSMEGVHATVTLNPPVAVVEFSEGEKTLDELQAVVTAQAGDYTLKE